MSSLFSLKKFFPRKEESKTNTTIVLQENNGPNKKQAQIWNDFLYLTIFNKRSFIWLSTECTWSFFEGHKGHAFGPMKKEI